LAATDRVDPAAEALASETEPRPAGGSLGTATIVRELRERLAVCEECRIVELGAPFCSFLVAFTIKHSFPSHDDRCWDWDSFASPCSATLG
jgi:hypothetical protein